MHAIIQYYSGTAGATDEVVRAGRLFAAALDRVPGFISCMLVREQSGGLAMVGLFDEQAGLEAVARLGCSHLAEHLPGLTQTGQHALGEVVFQRGL